MRAKVVWFILVLWFSCLLVLFFTVTARSEQITLEWDSVDNVDGYYLYQSIHQYNPDTQQAEHHFDYNEPIKIDIYPDGRIPQDVSRLTINLPGIENTDTRYVFTARAFRGDEQSADSNEVEYVVALTIPPAPNELAGSFDKEAGVINLSWVQPVETQSYRMISHFIVYCRQQGDEEWQAIGRIKSDNELTLQAPVSAIMSEEKATLEFTIVAYRRSGVYSHNSDILSLEIDRTKVPVIQNLRINIEIPVI